MSKNQSHSSRSWTENEGATSSRGLPIALLSILLIVVLTIFLRWIWVPPAPQVFAFAAAIDESREFLLPRPGFTNWSISDKTWGLWRPWLLSVSDGQPTSLADQPQQFIESVRTKNELDGLGSRIHQRFLDGNGTERDTVIVYLRGLALAASVDPSNQDAKKELFLLAPEFDGSAAVPQGVLLRDFLESLRQLSAANIVLLADFTDLPAAPQLAEISNDVPSLLAELMGEMDEQVQQGPSRPLWVICAGASGQPNHVSHILDKTLLQRSLEYALESSSPNGQQLSLSEFYETILRYAHHVTRGAQIPLLFRNGSFRPVSSKESPIWAQASKVCIATKSNQPLSQDNDSSSQLTPALLSEGREKSESVVSSGDPDMPPGETPPPIERDVWLRFWQLRDGLAGRQNSREWAPVDFAPDRWVDIQWQALRLQRLNHLGATSGVPTANLQFEIGKLNDELELSSQWVQNSLSSVAPSPETIGAAWIRLRREFDQPHRPERAWLFPDLLAPDLVARWKTDRQLLNGYMDCAAEMGAWLEMCISSDLPEINDLRPAIYELAEQFARIKQAVARIDTIMEHPIDSVALERAMALRRQLGVRLTQVVDRYAGLLEPTNRMPITWKTERCIQRLLSSPLLTYQQRKRLHIYYSSSSVLSERLEQPGIGNTNVDRTLNWPDLLEPITADQVAAQEWLSKLQPMLAGNSPQDQWLKGCFKGFWNLARQGDVVINPFGMIMPVSSDQKIYLSGMKIGQIHRHQLPEPLTLTIRHRNGTSVSGGVWFTWRQIEQVASPGANTQRPRVQAFTPLGASLTPGEPYAVQLESNDQTRFDWRMPPELIQSLEAVPVELLIAEDESKLNQGFQQSILLLPPNPERIDLFARSWDPATGQLSNIVHAAVREEGHAILKGVVDVPAVGHQAAGHYQIYVCNRSTKDKVVRAKLYPIQSSEAHGNGRVTLQSVQRTKRAPLSSLNAIAESDSIELPAASAESLATAPGELPPNSRPVVLKIQGEAPRDIASFGCLLVLEEVLAPEEVASQPEEAIEYFWIDLLCSTPQPLGQADRRLITVRPLIRGEDLEMQLEVNEAIWRRWQLESLRIELKLTDDEGVVIPNRELNATELSLQRPTATLSIRPDFTNRDRLPARLVMHLDIGGYPRAVAYQYRRGGGAVELATQAFIWLDPDQIQLTTTQDEPLTTVQSDSGRIVLPSRIGVSSDSTGKQIEIDQISIPLRIDFPRILQPYQATLGLDSLTPMKLSTDRDFESRVNAIEGRLVFTCSARDHHYGVRQVSQQASLRGIRSFVATVEGTGLQVNLDVAFDREPPVPAEVRVTPSASLYQGESLRLEVSPSDEHSGVASVYFALNRARGNEQEAIYDDADIKPLQGVFRNGRWQADFNADDYKEFLGAVGQPHQIVARTVDLAGNVQDRNQSARIYWSGQRQLEPPPVAKPEPPPKSELPKEFTVSLTVVADGKPVLYPERIQISGLDFAQMSTDGKGKFTFSKVPQGNYEIKGSYSLPSGTTFEAVQQLQVSASKSLTLNLRRTR